MNGRGLITSRHNPLAKFVRSLAGKKAREQTGRFVVEGVRLLEEALEAALKPGSGFKLEVVLYAPSRLATDRGMALIHSLRRAGVEIVPAAEPVMEYISDTSSPAGVLGVVQHLFHEPAGPPDTASRPFVLVLDQIQDPGNLGSLLRTAEAAGVSEVWVLTGSADCFSPKVVRATMGSIFRLPLRLKVVPGELSDLSARGITVYGTARGRGESLFKTVFPRPLAVVLGSEAQGMSPELESRVDGWVHIPMAGEVESLNVAAAGALVLYEIARQHGLLEHDFRDVL